MGAIRIANIHDFDKIIALDHIAQADQSRVACIQDAIAKGNCFIGQVDSKIIGYGVLEYSFYSYGFIAMLYIHPAYRRQGCGEILMVHMENACRTSKLFTSTNQSNKPMQALLEKLGFTLSGQIENLDPGDPELVYFKSPSLQSR